MSAPVHWTQIPPRIAATLPQDVIENDVVLPAIEFDYGVDGNCCPWPWESEQLGGAPMGQYHCSYCGSMEMAGLPHSDLRYWGKFDPELMVWVDKSFDELQELGSLDFPPDN